MYKSYFHKGPLGPVFFCIGLWFAAATATAQTMLLPVVELKAGAHTVQAEVAATDPSRALGLMHRESLPTDHGMLFVFDAAAVHCFWMKNTLLPLSIAFMDDTGKVLNIADMQPHSLDGHCPADSALYALEMEQGWFGRHGVQAGDYITGLPLP